MGLMMIHRARREEGTDLLLTCFGREPQVHHGIISLASDLPPTARRPNFAPRGRAAPKFETFITIRFMGDAARYGNASSFPRLEAGPAVTKSKPTDVTPAVIAEAGHGFATTFFQDRRGDGLTLNPRVACAKLPGFASIDASARQHAGGGAGHAVALRCSRARSNTKPWAGRDDAASTSGRFYAISRRHAAEPRGSVSGGLII
jgi:hypothetical protein